MSSSEADVVRITTGMWVSLGSDLIFARTCLPSYLGRLRSSRTRSTRGGIRMRAPLVQEVQRFLSVAGHVQPVGDPRAEGFAGHDLVAGVVFDEQDLDGFDGLDGDHRAGIPSVLAALGLDVSEG